MSIKEIERKQNGFKLFYHDERTLFWFHAITCDACFFLFVCLCLLFLHLTLHCYKIHI